MRGRQNLPLTLEKIEQIDPEYVYDIRGAHLALGLGEGSNALYDVLRRQRRADAGHEPRSPAEKAAALLVVESAWVQDGGLGWGRRKRYKVNGASLIAWAKAVLADGDDSHEEG